MKHLSFEPVKNWLGFTRRERRSSFILLILILSIAGLRFIVPERNMSIEEIPVEVRESIDNSVTVNSIGSSTKGSRIIPQKPLLDINKCDSASLEALPGIGPVLSARIIKYRNLLGGFASTDQLREVYGLSQETFIMVSGRLTADSSVIKRININSADYKQLIRLPYFDRFEVTSILKYRELKGRIKGMSEIVENKLISAETCAKVRPYLEFGE